MKIAFIWDWNPEYYQTITWKDGLAAALKELNTRHEVRLYVPGKREREEVIRHPFFDIQVHPEPAVPIKEFDPDVILHWADLTRPNAATLAKLGKPMAICFAGGEPIGDNLDLFDHVFVESQVYYDIFKEHGKSVSRAFGTNTDLYQPVPEQAKVFDAIFPATFAAWKRHELWADATDGLNAVAVGWMYPSHEQWCFEVCQRAGNLVLPHVAAEVLRNLYAASKTCVITSESSGGSQRTVLEAMAMNLPTIVAEDSDKTTEYVKAGGFSDFICKPRPESIRAAILQWIDKEVNTRDYILANWTHKHYADALEEGLLALV